jgi:hypothetical protein
VLRGDKFKKKINVPLGCNSKDNPKARFQGPLKFKYQQKLETIFALAKENPKTCYQGTTTKK